MADTLQRQISQLGSPTACLSLGDITFAAAIQRNRSASSSRSSSLPRARSSSTDNSSDSLFARAASLYIAGIVWAFSSSSPALVRRQTAIAATSVDGRTTTMTAGTPGSSAQPAVRDHALICNLLRNLTFVLQKAPFHRRRHHLNNATFIPPETQPGSIHQATLHDTLGVLGWTAPTTSEGDVFPGSSVTTTTPTIAYRLSKQFLPALLHAEDELMSASASSSVWGINNSITNSNNGALLSLLGDLSSAAAMAHNARRQHSSSSSLAGTDSAAEESHSRSQSPTSSYPASPELRLRDISRDNDEDEEVLNDSPPTTPSQTSSSDDLAKTFTVSRHVAFSNILQERLGGIDTTTKSSGVGFPRSNTIDTMSSGISSPVSRRSRASSIRSTASSIFEKMCGQPKAKTSVSVHTPEQKSTMGSFTPVSARTAANSLRRFGVQARKKSRLGVASARFWDSDDEEEVGGAESDTAVAVGAAPIGVGRRHARSATMMDVPAISMTHASFRPESMLDAAVANAMSAARARARAIVPPPAPAPSPVDFNAQTIPRALIPKSRTTSKPSPPIPSISSVLAARPNIPSRSNTDPTSGGIHGPARGLPKMDPTLAALEKGCRLKAKVSCAVCEKVGWDFPKNRQGMALCSRECRMAFKAASAEGKPVGGGEGVRVGVGA